MPGPVQCVQVDGGNAFRAEFERPARHWASLGHAAALFATNEYAGGVRARHCRREFYECVQVEEDLKRGPLAVGAMGGRRQPDPAA